MSLPSGWDLDIVLPEQWNRQWIRHLGALDGDRLLRVALLETAVKDIKNPHKLFRHRCFGCEASLWMLGSTDVLAIGFEDVCWALGLSKSAILRVMRVLMLPHLTVAFTIDLRTLGFVDASSSGPLPAGHE